MVGDPVVSNMAVVAAMGIIVPEKSLSPSNINEAVFHSLRLPWIGWYSPDFNLDQGPIGFDYSPVDNEFSLWHIGSLTPYIAEYKRRGKRRDINEAGKGEQDSPCFFFLSVCQALATGRTWIVMFAAPVLSTVNIQATHLIET